MPFEATIADIVKRKLDQARNQLVERNLRNRLVNCPLTSKRSKQIRVVDEISDEIFKALLADKKQMTFAPGRGVLTEDDPGTDPDYAIWTPPETGTGDPAAIAPRHRDSTLQTQLTSEGLQKRLTALYYESIESEEEQGINVLYLALGFLRWYEDARSEVARFAPLILVPVELARRGARERFQLKGRDEDLYTNISLKIWLAEQHSIQLPDLPDSDDWLPSEYFEQVRRAVTKAPRWAVLDSEVLLGFFSFNKLLLWRDLDPKNWPDAEQLLGHSVLRTLLAPNEESGQSDPPIIPEDSRIDDHFKAADQPTILDSDSSQTIAIQTAIAGRNVVIQGPPGTGKSQTIANIIAAAMHEGKTVLFVAEKLAALQVVYDRLRKSRLAHLCLELHSRRSSKQQVLAQLREALNSGAPPAVPNSLLGELDAVVASLWGHSDRIHRQHFPCGRTPYEVIGSICVLRDAGVPIPDFKVLGAENWTAVEVKAFIDDLTLAAERLQVSGIPARHPWRGSTREPLNPLDIERLRSFIQKLMTSLDALLVILRSVWPLVRGRETDDLHAFKAGDVGNVARALRLAAGKPDEPVEVLCNTRWTSDVGALDAIAKLAEQLAKAEADLKPMFIDSAWGSDWTLVRAEVAGSGRSMLRALRGPYRDAIRSFRGVCASGLPKSYAARISSLDHLIAAQDLRRRLQIAIQPFSSDLGSISHTLPGSWDRLSKLVGWLRASMQLEPALHVRNARLLSWSQDSSKWADRVTSIFGTVSTNFSEFRDFVRLSQHSSAEWSFGTLLERAGAWSAAPERFNEWPPVREHLSRLEATTDGGFHKRVFAGEVGPGGLVGSASLAIQEQVWNGMCATDPELARIDGRLLDRLVAGFRSLDRRRIASAADQVAHKHFEKKPTGTIGEMGIVRQELNKVRKLMPVRKFMDLAGNAIQTLKPVFLMSPLSIAQYLAPGRMRFDLLLIDEASQVRPEDAIGAVARAGQIVVVGDGKQLPPTNFFNRLVSDGDEFDEDIPLDDGTPTIGSMESILSLCDATLANRAMLRWHYRSHHPALIAVSNHSFYENKLLLPPSVFVGQCADGLGIVFHRTPSGTYSRGRDATNVVEADLVAEAVCRFAKAHPKKSLGVGTFSAVQRDVIRDRIDARRRDEPELESFFSASAQEAFFVKNLESIQGDERDVIFISVGYGRDATGRLPSSFGPINHDGGERRLNVLISRARERCEVFSPLTSDDIDVTGKKAGVVALRKFLQYAEKGYIDEPQSTGKPFDSDFEESVATFLVDRKYTVHAQVGMAGFYIDLGVLAPGNSSRYVLGIECDGATYHSSRSARDRDRIRQEILESRGWRIHRIWSTDWFTRRNAEERRLIGALEHSKEADSKIAPPVQPSVVATDGPSQGERTHVASNLSRSTVQYVEANFRVRSSDAPHEASAQKVQGAVSQILEIEGPIHADEVARRLATVWGLDRAGSRIQEVTMSALSSLRRSGVANSSGAFWFPKGFNDLKVRDRASAMSATLRKAEYLPPAEIGAAAIDVVRENVGVEMEALVVEIAKRFGFQRTGAELHDVIRKAIEGRLGDGLLLEENGTVKLAT